MKKHLINLAVLAALAIAPTTLLAQEESAAEDESGFSWNLGLTSDYVFRGVSQSDEEIALQGGLDYSFASGFYVGTWASTVDFGAGSPDTEVDVYVGWNTDLSDSWNFDVNLVRYTYHGESDGYGSIDYNELIGVFTLNDQWTFTAAYANDYGNSDTKSYYLAAGSSFDIGNEFSLDTSVGFNDFDYDGGGSDNFFDYSIGVSRAFGPVSASLQYIGTDSDGEAFAGDAAEDRVVLSITVEG